MAGGQYAVGSSRTRCVPTDRVRRVADLLRQGAALALVAGLGASWLSANNDTSPGAPYSLVSGEEPSSEPSSSPSATASPTSLDPSCATSQGVYPFPVDGPSSLGSVPPWVSSSESFVCVQLGGGDLQGPAPTVTVTADPEPSTTPGEHSIKQSLDGMRDLWLYAGGVLIFLTGIVAMRSRRT